MTILAGDTLSKSSRQKLVALGFKSEIKFRNEQILLFLENIKAPAMQELNYINIFT
ncbi:hypothetical protein [Desulfosporosinus sp.]|uniref:hypothetical protein n=1 Tax=Desulfosporosinus sp. TaxID=157907 RepID=UPI00231045FE|nr:hypothetical protein [Desulfosporosinus sp.]MCO5388199.1 hypothetical protein [Desulfosporosinus sp.]MDA8220742.1 hypothetical protein [Desulfitobacterium hafniense]